MNHKNRGAIIGGDSFVGSALFSKLSEFGFACKSTSRRRDSTFTFLDLSEPPKSWPHIETDVAIICAGVTSIASCAQQSQAASQINVNSTIDLVTRLAKRGTYILFLSTSQVFDGRNPGQSRYSLLSPVSEYGRQKACAEKAILQLKENVAVLRLTKVLTDDMKLLKHWRASLKDGNSIVCFDNLPLAPVSIEVVCELIGNLIKKRPSGIFHMSAANDITYHELAQRVGFKMGAENKLIHRDRASAANLNLFTLPKHATLEMSVESRLLRIVAPPAEQALAQLGL